MNRLLARTEKNLAGKFGEQRDPVGRARQEPVCRVKQCRKSLIVCRVNEWLPQPRVEIRKSPICSQVQLIPNCFEKKDRFPFNNTATVNTSFGLFAIEVAKRKPHYDKIFWFCNFNFLNTFRQSSLLKFYFFRKRATKKSKSRVCNIRFNFIGCKAVKPLNA